MCKNFSIGLVKYFVLASMLISLLSPAAFSRTACTNTEIIQSDLYLESVSQLKDCDQENRDLKEDLNKCRLEAKEDSVLWIFKASDVTAFIIGGVTFLIIL